MGLADLKKNASSCKASFSGQMSVEDFIDAASLYALGQTHEFANSTNVVDFLSRRDEQQTRTSKPTKGKKDVNTKPFKRATFTLSEQAINQLAENSQASQLAKSKLIRHLIAEHNLLSIEQKQQLYKKFEQETQQIADHKLRQQALKFQ
ncbi:hypothetical protein [Shewanella aestuarii]|uniref:CopG family transcriptional regulator n=1 Tax=Shewanella aestuarii TaxID=1028752 RepID=A0A6G9QHL0_9GAMM|nr:hypothetical protein [Shewanella aestuarii]QIR13888.1 hypothetical protein HBH39_04715 [Shewanella aestuarii]